MIHHASEFLKNALRAQGLSNTDLASVDPVLIREEKPHPLEKDDLSCELQLNS